MGRKERKETRSGFEKTNILGGEKKKSSPSQRKNRGKLVFKGGNPKVLQRLKEKETELETKTATAKLGTCRKRDVMSNKKEKGTRRERRKLQASDDF